METEELCKLPESASSLDSCQAAASCFAILSNENKKINEYNNVQREKLRVARETWNSRKQAHIDNNSRLMNDKSNSLRNERRDTSCKYFTGGCDNGTVRNQCGEEFPGWEHNECHVRDGCGATWGSSYRYQSCKRYSSNIESEFNNYVKGNIFDFSEPEPTQTLYPLKDLHKTEANILCCNNSINLADVNAENLNQICNQSVEQKNISVSESVASEPIAPVAPVIPIAPVAPAASEPKKEEPKNEEDKSPSEIDKVLVLAQDNMLYTILIILLILCLLSSLLAVILK